jgi:hypothetical protein
MTKSKKRIKWFWIFYALFIAALIILAVRFLRYVNDSLVLFEASQPERYMEGVLSSIKEQSPSQLLSNMELPELLTALITMKRLLVDWAQGLLASELSWRDGTKIGRTAVYELYSDGLKAAEVTIESVNEDVRLKLLSIPHWELKSIVL